MEVGLVPTLVGPLIDSFLQHLGKKIRRKLGSRRLAGLMSPASVFVPKELANYIIILLIRYGGKLRNSDDAANVEFNDIDGLKNVFAAERFELWQENKGLGLFSGVEFNMNPEFDVSTVPSKLESSSSSKDWLQLCLCDLFRVPLCSMILSASKWIWGKFSIKCQEHCWKTDS